MKESTETNEYLEFICKLAPALQELIPIDCIIGVADQEKFLCSLKGKNVSLPVNTVGTPLPEGAPIAKAIREKKAQKFISPKEVLGIEFQATAIPVFDMDGNVIGGIGLGIGVENKDLVSKNAENVAKSSEYVQKSVEQLLESAEKLAKRQENLLTLTEQIAIRINETQKIIEIINGIANTSKMLGLNATIEAARAGQESRGFSVVASEIQKMAANSRKAVGEVGTIISDIREKISLIEEEVNQTADIGSLQAASTKELTNTVTELSKTAKILREAAMEVIG